MDFLIKGSDYVNRNDNNRIVGRDTDIHRIVATLLRRQASSIILAGPGGVGCTSLCVGIQQLKTAPGTPFDLLAKRLFWLDTNGMFADAEPNAAATSFYKILQRLKSTVEPVLIIDDTHDFLESCRNNSNWHIINSLMQAIRNHKLQVIAEVKEDDIDTVLRSHADMRELFTIILIDEPRGNDLTTIVNSAAQNIQNHHKITIDESAINTAIELTNKYIMRDSRAQPERAITLIDRALASYRLSAHGNKLDETQTKMDSLCHARREGEEAIIELENQIDARLAEDKQHGRSGFESPDIASLRTKLKQLQEYTTAVHQEFIELVATANKNLALTREVILTEFANISGIPASKLNQDETARLKNLDKILLGRIYGQDEAIEKVVGGIQVMRIGRRTQKPLSFLFMGPSGVGKTELAKAIAAAILDDEASLTRFDMSEYMEKHAVAKLIGAPPGYEGYDPEGGILTRLIRRNPRRVLLFDEIEKAHPDVFNIMLQVLDPGRLTDPIGRTVAFEDTIIIFTTNIGQTHFLGDPTFNEASAAAIAELNATYRSEFLNRFNGRQNIICFRPLTIESIKAIVRREISRINSAYTERNLTVTMSDAAQDILCEHKYDPAIGARGLPGYISANLEPLLVTAILDNRGGTAQISYARETGFRVSLT